MRRGSVLSEPCDGDRGVSGSNKDVAKHREGPDVIFQMDQEEAGESARTVDKPVDENGGWTETPARNDQRARRGPMQSYESPGEIEEIEVQEEEDQDEFEEEPPSEDLWETRPVSEADIREGDKICKYFIDEETQKLSPFIGQVTGIDSLQKRHLGGLGKPVIIYKIVFQDGDWEHMTARQVRTAKRKYQKIYGDDESPEVVRALAAVFNNDTSRAQPITDWRESGRPLCFSATTTLDGLKAADVKEPKNYEEACLSPLSAEWKKALDKEFQVMIDLYNLVK